MDEEKDVLNETTMQDENPALDPALKEENELLDNRIVNRLVSFVVVSIFYLIIRIFASTYLSEGMKTLILASFVKYIMYIAWLATAVLLVLWILVTVNPKMREKYHAKGLNFKKTLFNVLDWGIILPICATVASFCFSFVFTFATVDGASMEPNFYNDDAVMIFYSHTFKRGDVIVAYINDEDNLNLIEGYEEYFIKRVIGLPGDSLTWVGGVLTINGEVVDETYFDEETKQALIKQGWVNTFNGEFKFVVDGKVESTFVIPKGYYFVMGDNRPISNDSRRIGLIPEENMIGKVKFLFYSGKIERVRT